MHPRLLIVAASALLVVGVIGLLFFTLSSWTPTTLTTLLAVGMSTVTPPLNEIARFQVLSTKQKNRTGMLVIEGEVMHFEYLDGQWAGTKAAPLTLIGWKQIGYS